MLGNLIVIYFNLIIQISNGCTKKKSRPESSVSSLRSFLHWTHFFTYETQNWTINLCPVCLNLLTFPYLCRPTVKVLQLHCLSAYQTQLFLANSDTYASTEKAISHQLKAAEQNTHFAEHPAAWTTYCEFCR